MSAPDVILNRPGSRRISDLGHPWVYRGGIASDTEGIEAGVVRILDDRKRFLGRAVYSPKSQIALRFLTRDDGPIDTAFFVHRLKQAKASRERSLGPREALRQVFAESDGLPSLIVDQYGPHLVVQSLSAGLEPLKASIIEALREVYAPASILARNDPAVRGLENLPREVVQWFGVTPERIEVTDDGITLEIDPWHGQKTGGFLDQAENRLAARHYTRGRTLDAFAYTGGFGLFCAGRASEVVLVDSSAPALAMASRNIERNGLTNVTMVEANAFDFLKSADTSGEKFDTVILDPPAFARNRNEVEGGVRGYKEINLRGMKLLNPGGWLITCSCSYHLTEELFIDVMASAAVDTRRRFRLVEKRTQGRDHPLLVGFPESYYLKCLILQLLD